MFLSPIQTYSKKNLCPARIGLFAFLAFFTIIGFAEPKKVIRIGYTHGIELNIEQKTFLPTLDYLSKHLPQYKFELQQVSPVDTLEDIKKTGLDFLFVPSNSYIEIGEQLPLTHIVSRRSAEQDAYSKSVGSVFIVRGDRNDINSISDLRNKTCAASQNNSLGGWLAAQGEIKRQGFNPEKFFSHVNFLQYQTPDVLNAVLSGASDVGILSTCTLENSVSEGLIEQDSLKVINPQTNSKHPINCLNSTHELYPDIVFVAVKGTPERIVRDVAVALLSMPPFGSYQWSFEDDYYAVRELLRNLQIGPFSYLRDNSLQALFNRFKNEISFGIALILFLLINELRLHFLVKKRTSQLKRALKEKIEADAIVKEERKKFSVLERNGLISQMSSILAHEAKQPISALVNYLEILRMRIPSDKDSDGITSQALNSAEHQVKRLNALVDSVRNFAKKKENPKVQCDLAQICNKALRTYERNEPQAEALKIDFKTELSKAPVLADPFSLELLILNLLRNGAQEALEYEKEKKPMVELTLETDKNRFVIRVINSGRIMNEREMKRLISLGESVKTEGLGLGLSIIRSIADQHSADLKFERRPSGGVIASFFIEKYGEE